MSDDDDYGFTYSDEDECDVYECSWEQHACVVDGKSACIPNCEFCDANFICDGEVDCDDGSDEQASPDPKLQLVTNGE